MIEFCEIDSRRDLAAYLGCQYKDLIYNLFVLPDDKRYKKIQIPKRNGDTRDILAPSSGIKSAQRIWQQSYLICINVNHVFTDM